MLNKDKLRYNKETFLLFQKERKNDNEQMETIEAEVQAATTALKLTEDRFEDDDNADDSDYDSDFDFEY